MAHAAAAIEPPVVILATPELTPISRRLQQEVEALGFNVQVQPQALVEPAEAELSSRHAVAAIVISLSSPGYITLYVLEPTTARLIKLELPLEAPKDPTAIELVATRAVELLRAARLDVSAERHPQALATPALPSTVPSATTKAVPVEQGATSQLLVGLGPGILYMPRWKPGTILDLTVSYLGTSQFGWMGSIATALTPTTFRVAGVGNVEAKVTTFRLGGLVQAVRPSPLGLRIFVGLEASQVKFTGAVQLPYISHTEYLSTLAPCAGFSTNLKLSNRIQLVARAASAWNLPSTVVRQSGQELRHWGQPSIDGALTLEWQLL